MRSSGTHKKKRLSHACNYCRSQKKRCDEEKPSCRKCIAAGQVCITTNPRRPGAPEVTRHRAGIRPPEDLSGQPRHDNSQQSVDSNYSADSPDSPYSSPSHGEVSVHSRRHVTSCEPTTPYEDRTRSIDSETRKKSHVSTTEPLGPMSIQEHHVLNVNNNDDYHSKSAPVLWPTLSNLTSASQPPLYADTHSAVNEDSKYLRKKFVGASSLQVFAQWVDLVLVSHGSTERLSDGFRFGMRHAEEFDLPLSVTLPSFSTLGEIEPCIDVFMQRINPLYPFVDEEYLSQIYNKFKSNSEFSQISRTDVPQLATFYAVLSVGTAELNGCDDVRGKALLDAAYSLLGHIISYPYLSSIQALGVIALCLRGRLRDGAASQIVGQAIRIAHSIGLHRGDISSTDPHAALYERVWCACYCLEKNNQFDSGRMSEVLGDFNGLGLIGTWDAQPHFARALLGLSQIQNRVSQEIFSVNGIQKSPQEVLPILADVDAELTTWTDSVSEIIRPGREFTICPTEMLPPATSLALQYYSTLAMIHRTSLLVDQKIHQSVIESTPLSLTAKHRLLAGESICVNAARSMVRNVHEMLARYGPSQLLAPQPSLLATYILVIHTIRHPQAWNVDSDINLIQKIASTTADLYLSNGQHSRLATMCSKLLTLATMIVSRASGNPIRALSSNGDRRAANKSHSTRSETTSKTEYGYEASHEKRTSEFCSNTLIVDPSTEKSPSNSHDNNSLHNLLNADDSYASIGRHNRSGLMEESRTAYTSNVSHAGINDMMSAAPTNLAGSPNTIDRLWTTTLTDSLDFFDLSETSHLDPYKQLQAQSSSTLSNSPFVFATEEHGIYHHDRRESAASLPPRRLLSPSATLYQDHQLSNPSCTLPEACQLLGVSWLDDLSSDLHLLYEHTPDNSS